MEGINKSYYAIIPANVRYDRRLCPSAKLLYGEVTALCNEKGYCWARNKYFADLSEVSDRTIRNWISQLIEYGYLKSEIKYVEGSKEIEYRLLYLPESAPPISGGPEKNFRGGPEKNFRGGPEKNFRDNNTSINNTNMNKESKKESLPPEIRNDNLRSFNCIIDAYTENEQLRNELKAHLKVRKNKKAALTNRAIELSLKKLDDLASNDAEKIQMVQNAIMSGWTTFYPLKADEKKKMGTRPSYNMNSYKSHNIFEDLYEESKAKKDFIDCEANGYE